MDGGRTICVAVCNGWAGMDVSVALVVIVSGDFVPVPLFGVQLMMANKIAINAAAGRLDILKSIFDSFVSIFQRFR